MTDVTRLETPFNMIIVGMTGCGKTHFVYHLKLLENEYKGHFEYIFLICPTYLYNKTYQEWEYKDNKTFFPNPCDQDHVEGFLKYITDIYSGTNSLIILDDCASSQSVKNRTSEMVRLAFSARHYGFSTIVITQQLTSITKPYGDNTSKMVTFYNPTRGDMKTFLEESLNVTKEEERDIIDKLKNNKYARLEVLRRYPFTHSIVYSTSY